MQIELKGLQRKLGISFVFVTHDQEEALTMSDRVAVINAGRVHQLGSAREVYERPTSEFVAGFIGLSNIVKGTIESSDGPLCWIRIGAYKVGAMAQSGRTPAGNGEAVSVMVRPEKIQLQLSGLDSGLPGKIQSQVYLGESTRWIVRLADGTDIHVVEQNREAVGPASLGPGDDVSIRWEPASAILLG